MNVKTAACPPGVSNYERCMGKLKKFAVTVPLLSTRSNPTSKQDVTRLSSRLTSVQNEFAC